MTTLTQAGKYWINLKQIESVSDHKKAPNLPAISFGVSVVFFSGMLLNIFFENEIARQTFLGLVGA